MEAYFILAEQFRTQDEPAFCGVSTMTMVLNALAVDPGKIWKGAWRWYHESMLDCCLSLEEIKSSGITFDHFVCLGSCNGLSMVSKRPTERHLYPRKTTKDPIIEEQTEEAKSGDDGGGGDGGCDHDANDCNVLVDDTRTKQRFCTLDEFREDVMVSCASSHGPIVIVSYSRKGLGQTGDGHFSPIAGYNQAQDMCLILDVARFKYPPHWVSTEVLYHAMCRLDTSCDKTRGWIVTGNAERNKSYYFTLNTTSIESENAEMLKDELCCCSRRFVNELLGTSNEAVDAHSECDHHGSLDAVEVTRCLLQCLPTPLDKFIVGETEKFGLTLEEKHAVIKSKLLKGIADCGVHQIVCQLFDDESNADLRGRFEKCLERKEVITLMVLVMGNDRVWAYLKDEDLAAELSALYAVDGQKYPELMHEVLSLQSQIRNLNEYLGSIYSVSSNMSCRH